MITIRRWLNAFIHRFIWCYDPYERIEDYNRSIGRIKSDIDKAEYSHDFFLIKVEIETFYEAFNNAGFSDFLVVVEGLYEYLSERIDKVQEVV
jgi:hypothetical protein